MGKSMLFNNAKNTVFKKWHKDLVKKGGKETADKIMDGIIDNSFKREVPKNLSKLTKITEEAAQEVKPKSMLFNNDWEDRKAAIKEISSGNKDYKKRIKKLRHKELNKLTNKNSTAPRKLFPNVDDAIKNEIPHERSKIYGDKEAFKDFKFSKNGPKKLYPMEDINPQTKESNFLKNAVPTAVGGAMIFTMMNRRGQQSNSQLYGQQSPYQ